MEVFDLECSLMLAQQYEVTLYYAVLPILGQLDHSARVTQYTFPRLRYIMVGAAPLAPDVAQRVQEKMQIP